MKYFSVCQGDPSHTYLSFQYFPKYLPSELKDVHEYTEQFGCVFFLINHNLQKTDYPTFLSVATELRIQCCSLYFLNFLGCFAFMGQKI